MDRVPPYSEEAERGVLGAILSDGPSVLGTCYDHAITPEAFYVPAHRLIYQACDWLLAHGKPVDLLTVGDVLQRGKRLDEVGGSLFLERLVDDLPTTAHAEFYIEIVQNKWLLRAVMGTAKLLEAEAMDGELSGSEVLSRSIQALVDIRTDRRSQNIESVMEEIRADMLAAKAGHIIGISSPFLEFNTKIGGLPFGMHSVLAGRGRVRKSYLVNQWVLHAGLLCEDAVPVGYFPLEDGNKVTLLRSACLMAGVSSWVYAKGLATTEQIGLIDQAMDRIVKSGITYCGGRGRNIREIALEVARGVAKHGWRFVVIDANKDVRGVNAANDSDVEKSGAFADMAERHNIAMLVTHHIRKGVSEDRSDSDKENQWVTLSDIKGRGEIVDDARMVMILQATFSRNERDEMVPSNFVLDCQKNNHGPPAHVKLDLDSDVGRFTERKTIEYSSNDDWPSV